MNPYTLVFVAALAIALCLHLWLIQRQIRWVRDRRDRPPGLRLPGIALDFTPAQHRKAADYTIARTRFQGVRLIHHSVLLLAWTLGGGLDLLDTLWRGPGLPPLAAGLGVIVSVALINGLAQLPLAVYHTFVIEQRFGFNHTRPALFVTDLLKETLLAAVFGVPLAALVLWLMAPGAAAPPGVQADPLWWLYVWLAWLGFSLLMHWLYPRFIAPLFNRFTPLADAGLGERLRRLLARTGFEAGGILVMDGSRRSAHGNAYFTGLGRQRRIVLFDTLLGVLTPAEIEAVLAHELGHYRHHHLPLRLAAAALFTLLGLLIVDRLLGQEGFYRGLGLNQASNHGALLLSVLIAPVFGTLLAPLARHFTRRQEYQADEFAARHADARALATALLKLYRENAVILTPDPLYSAFHDTHPPAAARLARLAGRGA